ncbi:MAG TPA: hypothetical protein DC049_15205, partial [Spirochaetia bacterium]|nr:hypothetical protein [Spirochaetia bacterium]
MKKINVGIIGLGFMGSTHFRIYQKNPKARLLALADIDPAKRRGDWRKICGNIGDGDNTRPVDLNGIKTCAAADDLINNPEIDLVDICLPTFLHKEYICKALAADKHVFCEKPIARTLTEAKTVTALAKKAKGLF